MILLYILGGILGVLLLYILFLGVCTLLVNPKKEYEKIASRRPFRPTDVYLDVLEVFPAQGIKKAKTEMIGTMVRHLIETNIEMRDGLWQKDM